MYALRHDFFFHCDFGSFCPQNVTIRIRIHYLFFSLTLIFNFTCTVSDCLITIPNLWCSVHCVQPTLSESLTVELVSTSWETCAHVLSAHNLFTEGLPSRCLVEDCSELTSERDQLSVQRLTRSELTSERDQLSVQRPTRSELTSEGDQLSVQRPTRSFCSVVQL